MERQIAALEADNSALVEKFRLLEGTIWLNRDEAAGIVRVALAQSHPGTALLAERERSGVTIKALADALLLMRNWRDDGTQSRDDAKSRCDAALRLAGRLP